MVSLNDIADPCKREAEGYLIEKRRWPSEREREVYISDFEDKGRDCEPSNAKKATLGSRKGKETKSLSKPLKGAIDLLTP
jgi:hypothetical protein